MLTNLNIKDFTLIEEMDIRFSEGLNVLTGETGAGKSIILDAINIIIGQESAARHYIRHGKDSAYLEAVFILSENDAELISYLKDNGIPVTLDLELIISRELFLNSRTITRINGRSASISQLKEIGNFLIDLHGQHEHQSLLKKEYHIKLLDALLPQDALLLKAEIAELYAKVEATKRKYNQLQSDARQRERDIELLKYEIEEISAASLEVGEDEYLECARVKIQNAEKLYTAASMASSILSDGGEGYGSILDGLKTLNSTLYGVADFDETLREMSEKAEQIAAELSEISYSLSHYSDNFDFSESEALEVEERINLVSKLKRKYGDTIEDVLTYLDAKSAELNELENYSYKSDEYAADIILFSEKLAGKAVTLSNFRKKTADVLQKEVEGNLQTLGMEHARFEIAVSAKEDENGLKVGDDVWAVNKSGIDEVEFYISPNKGEPVMPLVKIASGGEVSRVMLALKAAEAGGSGVPTVIFDEIDAGIGGVTAEAVGVKLAEVARRAQVIAVSHLTQIAIHAERHFLVSKDSDEEHTMSHIRAIYGEDIVRELARLQAGSNVTEQLVAHIRSLLREKSINN